MGVFAPSEKVGKNLDLTQLKLSQSVHYLQTFVTEELQIHENLLCKDTLNWWNIAVNDTLITNGSYFSLKMNNKDNK